MGFPLEHGLHSTLVAMRLARLLDADPDVARQTYYACLLFHVGCTADADSAAVIFAGDIHTYYPPVMFGSRVEILGGVLNALAPPGHALPVRAAQVARRLPKAMRSRRSHLVGLCEVAQMLTRRVGLPSSVQPLFAALSERWDGDGEPAGTKGEEIPLAVRIAHVARDAALQRLGAGDAAAVAIVRERAGRAFDPAVVDALAAAGPAILADDASGAPVWDDILEQEPRPHLRLEGAAIDGALAAMGDFADLVSPFLTRHSSGVAELAAAAGRLCRLAEPDVLALRRAALVHDLGRVAVPARIWRKPAALTADEWERVRLHAYHTERVLSRSPFLSALAPVATAHHERLDGSGYHRGLGAAGLTLPARILAAADAYHAMTEPRPHRERLAPGSAQDALVADVRAGRLDADAAAAVLEAAGRQPPRLERPGGLTEREAEVVGLLARGLQTKEIARALGISVKTADRHIQNAYGKIGVSTRAAATVFAMEHGLVAWGELPVPGAPVRS
jgi:HD-GYP domain-containing protein (c-di-GMP phosphodiesterase class II)